MQNEIALTFRGQGVEEALSRFPDMMGAVQSMLYNYTGGGKNTQSNHQQQGEKVYSIKEFCNALGVTKPTYHALRDKYNIVRHVLDGELVHYESELNRIKSIYHKGKHS